jgi:hypothetical protein
MKKIKSIRISIFSENDSYLKSNVVLDENGNEILNEQYLGSDELESKVVSKYNEQGLLVEEIHFDEDLFETERIQNFYDSDGKLNQSTNAFRDGSVTIKSIERYETDRRLIITERSEEGEFEFCEKIDFDMHGNIISRKIVDDTGKVLNEYIFEYNNQNELSKEIIIENKILISETTYMYNVNLQLLKRISYNLKGEIINWAAFEYNEQSKNTEQKFSDGTHFIMEYDESDKVVREKKINPSGLIEYSKEIIYNETGLIIEEIDMNNSVSYLYEYYEK